MSTTRQNVNPASPLSVVTRGIVNSKKFQIDRIINEGVAADYANYELIHAEVLADSGTLQTSFDPRRQPHETYRLYIGDIENGTKWDVLGWRCSHKTGAPMTHQIGRVRAWQGEAPSTRRRFGDGKFGEGHFGSW